MLGVLMSALLDYEIFNEWRKAYLAQQQTLLRWITIEGRHVPIIERPKWEKLDSTKYIKHPSGANLYADVSASEDVADQTYKAVAEVPPEHLEGLRSIYITHEDPNYPNSLADYDSSYQVISIYADRIKESSDVCDVASILKHEVGHHVFFKKLSPETRRKWSEFWKKHKNEMPTSYAKTRYQEGFAECYMFYFSNKKGDLSPSIQDFFKEIFKKGE
jgi:hypothetical protein